MGARVAQTMLLGWHVLPVLGRGPFWSDEPSAFIGDCAGGWLPTLALVGNFDGHLTEMCLAHSW